MSSPTESTTEQMVSLIDNIKGDIPDQKYIEIMDKLKELNEEEKTYKYIITHTFYEAITMSQDNEIKIKVVGSIQEILVELKEPLNIDLDGGYSCIGRAFLYYNFREKEIDFDCCIKQIAGFEEDDYELEVQLPSKIILKVKKFD